MSELFTPNSMEEAFEIYGKLTLIRQSQEKIISEYHKDEIKTPVHLGIGLEGISVGVAQCLPSGSRAFGQLRNHGQYLSMTGETDSFFGELYGKVTGTGGGKAGSMHLSAPDYGLMSNSGIVSSTIPLAVGSGLAAKYLGTNDITVAMFGDAAIEEGEFWESLNFACLHGLRVLFVCEDNDMSIYTTGAERRGFKSIMDPVRGFNCHTFEGDGTDVRSVIPMVQQAIDMVLSDPKPAFLCFSWFRLLDHVGVGKDFGVSFRPIPTAEEINAVDPIYKYEQYLLAEGYDPAALQSVRDEIETQIENSVARAIEAEYPSDTELYQGVFS